MSLLRGMLVCFLALSLCGCPGPGEDKGHDHKDPHIVRRPDNLRENPKLLSPPTLGHPIYACGSGITAENFIPGAKIEVFIDGAPAANPSFIGHIPTPGETHDTGAAFTVGQSVYVTQTFNGVTSAHSNTVPVTSHKDEFPNGLPKPRLFKHPLLQCGHAVLVEDVIPDSKVTIQSEDPNGTGGFMPAANVGGFQASTNWGLNWSGVNPQFSLNARISASAEICTDSSPRSDPEITEPGPSPVPPGSVQSPVIDSQQILTIWGQNGPPNDSPQHGAIVTVRDSANTVRGQSPVPGGVPHNLWIGPAAVANEHFSTTQALCTESVPGPTITVGDCKALPAPTIKPPLPGDTTITVTTQIPGAEILVFASGQEVGHSAGSTINLTRAVKDGETIVVEQRLGKCTASLVYEIKVGCALGNAPGACSSDWPAFRQNGLRTARQVQASALGDPYAVKTLGVRAQVTAPDGGVFVASPVVFEGRVFVGSNRGHLYAFDAHFGTGAAPLWQYPPANQSALSSQYTHASCHNPSSEGVSASVAIAQSKEHGKLVILEAPDLGRPDDPNGKFGMGLGSGRVFAVNPTNGTLVWKTREEIARITGTTAYSTSELHEQIGYSSPLVLGERIYVGIGDHCDNPIQNGKVKAIDLETGAVDSGFDYQSTSTRGGGVWTFVSGGLGNALVTTTGNVKAGNPGGEPSTNNGLSMIRLDPVTGTLNGKIQPVPFVNDGDPDWAAGATLMAASCGNLSASTMKDGFSYAGNLGPPLSFRWQYPNVSYPFPIQDPLTHGDIRYHRAGAAWNDTYFSMAGGQQLLDASDPNRSFEGYRHLHAYDVCAAEPGRVRWVALLENYTNSVSNTHDWALGPPTVTEGIVYVGTNRGFLLAIADPSVWPSHGAQCTMPTLNSIDCVPAGFQLVANPTVLKAINLSGQILRNEPVLANGMLYVGNSSGTLFRIAPEGTP